MTNTLANAGETHTVALEVLLSGRLPKQDVPRVRIFLADGPSLWRDALKLLLSMQSDLEVVGDASASGSLLPQMMQNKPDVVICDSERARAVLPELLILRHRGVDLRLVVLNLLSPTNDISQHVRAEATAIIPQNSPSDLLLRTIRSSAGFEPQRSRPIPAAVPQEHFNSLSPREKQLATLVGLGLKNREIADSLFISEQTVKNHLRNIFMKTGIKDRLQLALSLVQDGLYK